MTKKDLDSTVKNAISVELNQAVLSCSKLIQGILEEPDSLSSSMIGIAHQIGYANACINFITAVEEAPDAEDNDVIVTGFAALAEEKPKKAKKDKN